MGYLTTIINYSWSTDYSLTEVNCLAVQLMSNEVNISIYILTVKCQKDTTTLMDQF